jgi:hypothetical protein
MRDRDDVGDGVFGRDDGHNDPSSTVAIMPHSGSQIRQKVALCSIACRPYCNGYSSAAS